MKGKKETPGYFLLKKKETYLMCKEAQFFYTRFQINVEQCQTMLIFFIKRQRDILNNGISLLLRKFYVSLILKFKLSTRESFCKIIELPVIW